jgi:predicted phage terminase large subunit-like protein
MCPQHVNGFTVEVRGDGQFCWDQQPRLLAASGRRGDDAVNDARHRDQLNRDANGARSGGYPDLVAQAIALWRKWKFEGYTTHLVVEDKGSGSSLIQSLKNERIYVSPCKLKLEGDKVMRLTAEAAEFHSGSVNLREDARWVGELVAELLGFPGARHDDQVDSVSQALAFMGWLDAHRGSSEELRKEEALFERDGAPT